MAEFTLYAGQAPAVITVGDTGAVFTNAGPSLVYYASGKVSTSSYDGTLAVNASVTLYGTPHFTIGRSSDGAVRADVEYVPAASASTPVVSKQAMLVLNSPTSAANPTLQKIAEMVFRMDCDFPVQPTWIKLRIRNWDLATDAAVLTGASFTATYVGEQATDANGAPTAGFKAAPVQAFPAFTLAADGTEYVSATITDSTVLAACAPGKRLMFSFAYTGGDTTTGQATGTGGMWYQNTGGSSSLVSQTAATGIGGPYQNVPFDIRIEYGFSGTQKVVLVVADSIAVSGGSGLQLFPYQRWPESYGRDNNVVMCNAGLPSSKLSDWATSTKWMWQRMNPTSIAYDGVMIALGINDSAQAASLATMKTRLKAIDTALLALPNPITKRWGMCLTPYQGTNLHSQIGVDAPIGSTTLTCRNNVATGAIRIGSGSNLETFTIATSTTVSNGVYTVTLPSATTKFHPAGEVITAANEQVRQDYNAYLQTLPIGLQSVGIPDRFVQWSVDPLLWDPSLTADQLHPNPAGHQVYKRAVPEMR